MDLDDALAPARTIYQAVIETLDPAKLVRRYLRLAPNALVVGGDVFPLTRQSRLVVIGLGKASPKMMMGALSVVGPRIDASLIITKVGVPIPHEVEKSGIPIILAGHPVPDAESLRAGKLALRLATDLGPDDILLMLISGGGSALMELPLDGLTLDDLQKTTELVMHSGVDIYQLNAVRQRLSQLKGGGLAAAAAPATVINLIVSDVLGNPLSVIASGPTVPYDPAIDRGVDSLARSPVWPRLRGAVRDVLAIHEPDARLSSSGSIHSTVVADAQTAAESAARAARTIGYASEIVGVAFAGEAREFAEKWVVLARNARDENDVTRPTCLVGAGELAVTVAGAGSGGRNSEMLLAAAMLIDGDDRLAIASLATDGDDGNTGAAGGVVTGESCQVAREAGLDPTALLKDNDSQRFLDAAGRALRTGLTGTNVNDIYLAFIDGPPESDATSSETHQTLGNLP